MVWILYVPHKKIESIVKSPRNMPRNVEIKARVNADLKELIERVFCFTKLNTLDLTTFTQEDTFFQLPNDKNGMLKLRKNQMVSLHGMMPWVQKVLSAQVNDKLHILLS